MNVKHFALFLLHARATAVHFVVPFALNNHVCPSFQIIHADAVDDHMFSCKLLSFINGKEDEPAISPLLVSNWF
jgi:hypothetical protein